jgi:hypothetical protein
MGAGEGARGIPVWTQASAGMTGMARSGPEGSLFRVTLFQVPKNWATRCSDTVMGLGCEVCRQVRFGQ